MHLHASAGETRAERVLSTFTLFYAGRYQSLPLLRFWQYVAIVLLVGGGWLVVDIVRDLRGRPKKK